MATMQSEDAAALLDRQNDEEHATRGQPHRQGLRLFSLVSFGALGSLLFVSASPMKTGSRSFRPESPSKTHITSSDSTVELIGGSNPQAAQLMHLQKLVTHNAEASFLNVQYKKTQQFVHEGLTPATLPRASWWPGCGWTAKSIGATGNLSCLEPCLAASVFEDMEKSFTDNPAELVEYKSRSKDGVTEKTLRGWLFPAVTTGGGTPPRMVIQHGFTALSNEFRDQFWAYLFRKLGFTVLVNNLRDHGYSDNTTKALVGWGHSYPYDLLGAWDYMVQDPDNKMGGAVDPSKVGLTGYSMGAYITSIAMALEPKVPGAWVDSAPSAPKNAFEFVAKKQLEAMGAGALAPMLLGKAWSSIVAKGKTMGIDIEENLPAEVLPLAPDTQRPVFWMHNTEDLTVGFDDGKTLLALYEKYPEKFKVSKEETTGQCHGSMTGAHAVDHIRDHTEVSKKLCTFFSDALNVTLASC